MKRIMPTLLLALAPITAWPGQADYATPLMRQIIYLGEYAQHCIMEIKLLGEAGTTTDECANFIARQSRMHARAPDADADADAANKVFLAAVEAFNPHALRLVLEIDRARDRIVDASERMKYFGQPIKRP